MWSSILLTLIGCVVALVVFAMFGFALSQMLKRLDVADVLWGLGFGVVAIVSLLMGGASGQRGYAVTALVVLWGVRLATHVTLRRRGKPEDRRYAAMKAAWVGNQVLYSFMSVFLAQAALTFVVVAPVIDVNITTKGALNALDWLGIIMWLVGFLFESVGDFQLSRFLAQPENKGRLMTQGLWRYTRHPNYFGEILLWWGLYVVALSVPYGWVTIFGPLTLTWLIVKVSGVPLLEKRRAGQSEWEEYKERTSMLVPLPPKNL